MVSAALLLLCLCLPLSGRYVDGPLITVFKTYFIWDDFDPQQTFSWLLLFGFVWPAAIVCFERVWQENRMLMGILQIGELVAAVYSCIVIAMSALFRYAASGMYVACTALGVFALCAIIEFCQILYSEIQRIEDSSPIM
ncbi:MAG: hypothetical protein AB1898_21245 [Acidobacteriota bacterium]